MSSAVRSNAREHRASILVAAVSAAFGVVLVAATNVVSAFVRASSAGDFPGVQVALTVVGAVFFVIAVYVGAIVTTNTFATVIAGRTRTIALMRLIGSSARAERRAVAREGLMVGVLGAGIGGAVAALLALLGVTVLVSTGTLPQADYPVLSPAMLVPLVSVLLTTWLASWIGSRRVLTVTPIQALSSAQERPTEVLLSRARLTISILLLVVGVLLLTAAVLLGVGAFASIAPSTAYIAPYALLIALPGGVISSAGFLLLAPVFVPAALRAVGLLLGRGAPSRLAAANAVRNPERSSRTALGLIIGVALITMFVVAIESWREMIARASKNVPEMYESMDGILTAIMVIFLVLVGFSAVIAAVGVVNSLSLSVMQRRRELGLLRALGLSSAQVRRMILAESVQLTVAAVICGVLLGAVYGWAGAQTLLGGIPGGGVVVPQVPWLFLGLIAAAAAALAVAASMAPTRRATAVSPVEALAVE